MTSTRTSARTSAEHSTARPCARVRVCFGRDSKRRLEPACESRVGTGVRERGTGVRVRGNGRMMTGCHVSSDRTRDVWGARVGRAWDYGCACVSLFGVHTASGVCCVELWMLRHGCARRSERRPEVSERHAQRGPDIYSVCNSISGQNRHHTRPRAISRGGLRWSAVGKCFTPCRRPPWQHYRPNHHCQHWHENHH